MQGTGKSVINIAYNGCASICWMLLILHRTLFETSQKRKRRICTQATYRRKEHMASTKYLFAPATRLFGSSSTCLTFTTMNVDNMDSPCESMYDTCNAKPREASPCAHHATDLQRQGASGVECLDTNDPYVCMYWSDFGLSSIDHVPLTRKCCPLPLLSVTTERRMAELVAPVPILSHRCTLESRFW